jgi:thiol:disulfide interchange protein DsbA
LARAGRQFVLLAGILALAQSPMTYAQKFEEGVHYHVLPQAQPVQTGDQIEVLELFWYHCPHCFALEPVLEEWIDNEKPQNADYVRMPGIANKSWIFDARVFYALEALGLLDQMHADVFNEIHVRKNPFKELSDLQLLLEKHGVSETEFAAAFNSFAVDMKTKNAQKMMMRYQATGVPTIVVDGKYRASASTAGGHRELIELTNYLVDKAAAERR